MNKYIAAVTLVACTTAYANDPNDQVVTNTNQIEKAAVHAMPWDIIGNYESTVSIRDIKFIKPTEECIFDKHSDNVLLLLSNCHQKRIGWLKI